MATLCDVNLLLALCYDRHIHHPAALAWLETQGQGDIVLCRSTQLSLLRLLSHALVMGEDVCTLSQAWNVYDAILSDGRFEFASEPEGLEVILRESTQSGPASPKLWGNAYLAAFARAANMGLATFDQGYRQFKDLQLALLDG